VLFPDSLLNLLDAGGLSNFYTCTSKAKNIIMAQIRGTAGYHLGGGAQNHFGGPGSNEATNDPSPLDAIREQTSKIEDWLDTLAEPLKPYVDSHG